MGQHTRVRILRHDAIDVYDAATAVRRTRRKLDGRWTDVERLVVHEAFDLVTRGLAIGLIGAFLLATTMEKLLFGVTAFDLPTLASATVVRGLVGVVACYLRRAARGSARCAPSRVFGAFVAEEYAKLRQPNFQAEASRCATHRRPRF